MKKLSNKIISIAVAMIIVFSASVIPMTNFIASAANDTFENAISVELEQTYTGKITENVSHNYYKIILPEAGKLKIDMLAFANVYYDFYGQNKEGILTYGFISISNTPGFSNKVVGLYLTAGTYYLDLHRWNMNGECNVTFYFDSSSETIPESYGGSNESLNAASEIELNKKYIGVVAKNESYDFYKFTLDENNKVKIKFHTDIASWIQFYNSKGEELYGNSYVNNDYVATGEDIKEYNLKKGTYYFVVRSTNGIYSTYSLMVECEKVLPKSLTSISLATLPSKTEYLIGDTLNVNGLSVEAEYSDGTKKTVEGYSITGFDSSSAGKKTVTITYTENGVTCTSTFDVTVSEPAPAVELASIAYVTLPSKTTYKVGEGFNYNGLTVSAKYSDGSTKLINNYTLSGFDSSTAGVKTVTVSYTENGITKTCTFSVTVLAEKKLIAISIASMPSKTTYQIGEDFEASGLIVNAFYDDGTTAFVTDYTVSGFDSETPGKKTVVVAYTDKGVTKNCTFEVTVEEPAQSGSFFTNLINSIVNFFMSIIEFFTSLLGG
ncbi:MAG: bacterial Ig-like domain-containing protein [Clostridia bacterium]|nr:bacterial Ig-like domain-containing protein [Clostridia bacterium]